MGGSSSKKDENFLMVHHNLTREQVKQVKQLYRSRCGVNNYLSFSEFAKLYTDSRFERSEEDLRAVYSVLADSDSKMRLAAFGKLCLVCGWVGDMPDAERLKLLFAVMDADNSGQISDKEFHQFLSNFVDDKDTTEKFFKEVDTDDSKLIDFEEFCEFCSHYRRITKAMIAYTFPVK